MRARVGAAEIERDVVVERSDRLQKEVGTANFEFLWSLTLFPFFLLFLQRVAHRCGTASEQGARTAYITAL
jgi:hypothetical protein